MPLAGMSTRRPELAKERFRVYLEGPGDLVSRLILVIAGVTIWATNLLTKLP